MKKRHMAPFLGLALIGCASASGTHPDDMSAKAHRAEAMRLEAEAKKHGVQYDPNLVTWQTHGDPHQVSADQYPDFPGYVLNPTQAHLERASQQQAHAQAHREAAKALEVFETQECAAFPRSTRAMCPLLGAILAVEDVDRGARIRIDEGIDPDGLIAHIRCHFAAGRTAGQKGMPQCPLYLKGLSVRKIENRVIELTSTETSAVEVLRRRLKAHAAAEL